MLVDVVFCLRDGALEREEWRLRRGARLTSAPDVTNPTQTTGDCHAGSGDGGRAMDEDCGDLLGGRAGKRRTTETEGTRDRERAKTELAE